MARLTYLERRGATYYARVDIPVDLVSFYGTTTRKKSLRTKDGTTAKARLWPIIDEWRNEFHDIRSRRALTSEDKAAAVWQHYSATLERDDLTRRAMPTEDDLDVEELKIWRRIETGEIGSTDFVGMINAHTDYKLLAMKRELDAERRQRRLRVLKEHLTSGQTKLVAAAADAFFRINRLIIDPNTDDYLDVCRLLMRAEVEALERTLERDRGDYGGAPKDPIVKPSPGMARNQAQPGETILELFEQYARENPRGVKADTLNQARRDIRTFVDHVGVAHNIQQIDKKAVRGWKALLMRYPVKATESNDFEGMKLDAIVRANEKIGKPVITPRTVNRYLSSLGAFCDWLVSHGYLDQNPTTGMSLAKEKKTSTLPFTSEQLNVLFSSPLFTGCSNSDEWRKIARPGTALIRDHRYWVPLIMLFSGARPAEIAQLAVADVRHVQGHWIMHITTEGDDEKSVKTKGSMRVVPIHDELIQLGFTEYRNEMEAAGQTRLFPDAKRNSRGQMIAEFSREFGRYLTRLKIKKGRGLSLYSFRHGATDALRRAGHLDEHFGFLLGHAKASMTGRYGTLPQGMLPQRVELVNSIAYPGLAISHLRRRATTT